MLRSAAFFLSSAIFVGCAHHPDTVVHLTAPTPHVWVVRNHAGVRLCSLPCTVELEEHEAVVVGRDSGTHFIVHQENLGAGTWNGAIRIREEPSKAAAAIQAFSGMLVTAGSSLVEDSEPDRGSSTTRSIATRRGDRTAAGLVLSGLGTVGLIASSAWPGKSREELWLDRMTTSTP